MLVLSRKFGEKIIIGHDIEVTVMAIRGDKVQLGITAPLSVSVHREEIERAIEQAEEGER